MTRTKSSTWRNIRLILHREVRDQLRDRRTLFMVVVLPLMLYPGMGVGMLQMAMYFTEQPRQVVILGADHLPEPALLEGGRFATHWFSNPETSSKLRVLTDSPGQLPPTNGNAEKQAAFLKTARYLAKLIRRRNELVARLAPWDPKLIDELSPVQAATLRAKRTSGELPTRPPDLDDTQAEFDAIKLHIGEVFASSKFQVLLIIPEGLGENVSRISELLEAGKSGDELSAVPLVRLVVARNRADDKSEVAYARVREALDKWEKQILRDRLDRAGIPETVPDPISVLGINVANQEEIAASMWSKLFPGLLVIMALTGAFYPAIDVAAGEKERGTMETLLICPATRSEIVVGKFLTVMLFSLATTILNLISMGLTGRYIMSVATGGAGAAGVLTSGLPLPTPLAIVWLMVLLIPLAAFFSALCLALATFARSNKEGQYYLTPLFMVTIGLTMFAMSPTIELSTTASQSLFYCAMPVVGPALLLKALLVNPSNTGILVFGLPVLMSSVGYAFIALWWAVEQFKSEEVLFREAEQFDLKLWLRHLLRDKDPTPTFTQAAGCFVLMLLLQFASISFVGGIFNGLSPEEFGRKILQMAVVQQIALIGAPALFMAVLLTSSARKTLKLRMPSLSFLGAAIVLPIVLHPLASELLSSLSEFFPQLPESAKAAFAAMSDDSIPLIMIIGTFALAPAICEEIAFRGFILSGFSRGGRMGVAVVLSSVTFGIIHMIPQQVFNATLLGLVLGLLAIRSGSLLPGIIFHLLFNSLAVLHSQATATLLETRPAWLDSDAVRWLIVLDVENSVIRYNFLTLILCGVVATLVIRWLIRMKPGADTTRMPALASPAPTLTASQT
jgi:sodium transport system permease protein